MSTQIESLLRWSVAGLVSAGLLATGAVGVVGQRATEAHAMAGPGMAGGVGMHRMAPPPPRRAVTPPPVWPRWAVANMATRHVDMLRARLGLDDARATRLHEVFTAHFQAMEAIQAYRSTVDRATHRAQVAALWRGTNQRVAQVLTPEQYERYLRWSGGPGPMTSMPRPFPPAR